VPQSGGMVRKSRRSGDCLVIDELCLSYRKLSTARVIPRRASSRLGRGAALLAMLKPMSPCEAQAFRCRRNESRMRLSGGGPL
jgi:hypothetical protein